MRMITFNPSDYVPDISEQDIHKAFIIARLPVELAFLVHNDRVLNWFGGKYGDRNDYGFIWSWDTQTTLLKFLIKCYDRWSEHNVVKFYICENIAEVIEVSSIIESPFFAYAVYKKALEVFHDSN